MKFLLLALIFVGFVGIASAQSAEKLVIDVDIQRGNVTTISGTVTDSQAVPVVGASVQILTSLGTAETLTDEEGSFAYDLPVVPAEDMFSASVKAEKDGYATGYTNTSFFTKSSGDKKSAGYGYKVATADKLKDDPMALKILENIEQSKRNEEARQKRIQEIKERQRFIEEQRAIADQRLLEDLQGWFDQFDPFKPRNVFSVFVSQIDSTVQDIYWAQFNFTEARTLEGLAAMQEILNNNGTMHDARMAFYEKAASTQSEINKLNDELNAKYGKNHTEPAD